MTNVTDDAVARTGPAHIPWIEVASRAHDDAGLSLSHLALVALAGVLAAAAILTDNIILVIGAMIVAPDFEPAAGFSIGVVSRRWGRVGGCLAALGLGYAIAAVTGFVITTIATSLGHVPTLGSRNWCRHRCGRVHHDGSRRDEHRTDTGAGPDG